ncbi:MAG TPA: P-loop NTPase [Planctomycetaceae bacterium]|jgi:capsular exopolysaccharide synthesis family protein|nr:P-loop NTPase [Planctomycetaceae bacterium]
MSAAESNDTFGDSTHPADVAGTTQSSRGARTPMRPDIFSLDGSAVEVAPALHTRNLVAEILHALRRHWLRASFAGLVVGALAAIGVGLGLPRLYTATVVLRVSAGQSNILELNKNADASILFDLYKRTQKQLVRGPMVLAGVLQRQEVASLPLVMQQVDQLAWLQKVVNVTFPDDAEIMEVSVRCEEKRTAETLADKVVEVYLSEVVGAERQEKLVRIASLQKAQTETETDLRKRRSGLRQLADALGTSDSEALTLAQKNTLEEYSVLWKQLNQVEWDLKRAQSAQQIRQRMGAGAGVPISDAEVDVAATMDPIIATSKARLENLQVLIDDTHKTSYGAAENEHVAPVQASIERNRKRIEDRKQALRKELALRKQAAEQPGMSTVEILDAQKKELTGKVEALRKEAEKFGRSSVDVELMRAEIKALESLCDRIQRELREANIEMASLKARIAKISGPNTPMNDDWNRRVMLSASSGVFGTVIGCALVLFWDLRRRRLNTLLEIAEGLRLPILGTMPRMQRGERRDFSNAEFAQAVDGIAARLIFAPGESPQVVLVTSASAGEGKTTVALNLATSFAGMGRRTALVDFDLRRPALHEMLGVELTPGVSAILAHRIEPLEAVLPTSTENLFLLPAGAWGRRTLSPSNDEMVQRIVSELRAAFVHVVIDAGPVLPVVETRVVARHADGVVLSLLRDISEIPKVQSACELLRSFNIRMLGAVMVGAPSEVYYSRTKFEEGEVIVEEPV